MEMIIFGDKSARFGDEWMPAPTEAPVLNLLLAYSLRELTRSRLKPLRGPAEH